MNQTRANRSGSDAPSRFVMERPFDYAAGSESHKSNRNPAQRQSGVSGVGHRGAV